MAETRVVICGGGIIGSATAYYLTKQGARVTVVERTGVANAASGKAGGFLARGWGGGDTEELHEKGFDLHEQLAEELKLESFRHLPTYNVTAGNVRSAKTVEPEWLDGNITECRTMDPDTAQVTPKELTHALMNAAVANGARLEMAQVTNIVYGQGPEDNTAVGVELDGARVLEADKVLIAMGPWSVLAEEWLGIRIPMEGIRSTSVIYKTQPGEVSGHALFCAEDKNGCHLEVYPRPDGEVYVCGIGGSSHLGKGEIAQLPPEEVTADPTRVSAAMKSMSNMASFAKGGREPEVTQACMRPCSADGKPILGLVPTTSNCYIATGHNCWGILWSAITGKAMSELILTGSCSVDLRPFSPQRYNKKVSQRAKRGRHRRAEEVGEQW